MVPAQQRLHPGEDAVASHQGLVHEVQPVGRDGRSQVGGEGVPAPRRPRRRDRPSGLAARAIAAARSPIERPLLLAGVHRQVCGAQQPVGVPPPEQRRGDSVAHAAEERRSGLQSVLAQQHPELRDRRKEGDEIHRGDAPLEPAARDSLETLAANEVSSAQLAEHTLRKAKSAAPS